VLRQGKIEHFLPLSKGNVAVKVALLTFTLAGICRGSRGLIFGGGLAHAFAVGIRHTCLGSFGGFLGSQAAGPFFFEFFFSDKARTKEEGKS
jgi:hypothetical protein